MPIDFVEIDIGVLKRSLSEKGFSHNDLATELQITTKTIQRWLNGTVKKVRPETLQDLARILEVSIEDLRKNNVNHVTRTFDSSLQELCADSFTQRIRCHNDWLSYRKILRSYLDRDIPTQQMLLLCKQIGMASLFMGEIRAARLYLERALEIAEATNSHFEKVYILNWLGICAELRGQMSKACEYFAQSKTLTEKLKDPRCDSDYHFKLGRLLHCMDRPREAAAHLRRSILIDQKNNMLNQMTISIKYFHLLGAYIRGRDYEKACSTLARQEKWAERAGWTYGQSYGYFCKSLLKIYHKKDGPLDTSKETREMHATKGRRIRTYTNFHGIDCKVEQLEYFHCLHAGRFAEAKVLLTKRFNRTKRSALHFANTVVDGLFLQKLHPETFTMRPSFIQRAVDLFERNQMERSLALLENLQARENLSHSEFMKMFPF